MTVPEFADLCRERCANPSQGWNGSMTCGEAYEDASGETVFTFCGAHMAFVVGGVRADDWT